MTAPRYQRRRDGNHSALVSAFERLGCSVADMTKVGIDGFPDVLVGCAGVSGRAWHLVEFKDPSQAYGRKGLSKPQKEFDAASKGEAVYCVNSVDGVIALVNEWRRSVKVPAGVQHTGAAVIGKTETVTIGYFGPHRIESTGEQP